MKSRTGGLCWLEQVHPRISESFALYLKLAIPAKKIQALPVVPQLLKETPHEHTLRALHEVGSESIYDILDAIYWAPQYVAVQQWLVDGCFSFKALFFRAGPRLSGVRSVRSHQSSTASS